MDALVDRMAGVLDPELGWMFGNCFPNTLDTTVRRLELPGARRVLLSDTVGLVAKLPHDLVRAFHSTLEEVAEVDLIVMGRSTYEAVLSYGAGAWPYPGKETIVLTSRALDDAPAEVSARSDLAATVAEIEGRGLGRVWIVSAVDPPYSFGLDVLWKAQGVRLSMRLCGWPAAMALRTKAR